MCVGFVGGIHEDETRGALRVIGREHTDVETRDGGPDEHHRSGNPAAAEECGQLARDAACCPRRWARIAVTHTCTCPVSSTIGERKRVLLMAADGQLRGRPDALLRAPPNPVLP